MCFERSQNLSFTKQRLMFDEQRKYYKRQKYLKHHKTLNLDYT